MSHTDRLEMLREMIKSGAALPAPVSEFLEGLQNSPRSVSLDLPMQTIPLPIHPGVFLNAFELARPLSPTASQFDGTIHQILILSLTAAQAACNMAWDMEEDGETNTEAWLDAIRRGYFDLIQYMNGLKPPDLPIASLPCRSPPIVPSPLRERPPSPSHGRPPSPSLERPPCLSLASAPSPSCEHPPSPSHGRPPSPSHGRPPSPSHGRPPSPSHGRPPSPSHGRPPSPSLEPGTPSLSGERPPVISQKHSASPSGERPPSLRARAPSVSRNRSLSGERPPAVSHKHPASPSGEQPPSLRSRAPSVSRNCSLSGERSRSVSRKRSRSVSRKRLRSVSRERAPSSPSVSCERKPSALHEHLPSVTGKRAPSVSGKRAPAVSREHPPSISRNRAPSPSGQRPLSVHEVPPSVSHKRAPSVSHDRAPTGVRKHAPSLPSISRERALTVSQEQAPSTSHKHSPSVSGEHPLSVSRKSAPSPSRDLSTLSHEPTPSRLLENILSDLLAPTLDISPMSIRSRPPPTSPTATGVLLPGLSRAPSAMCPDEPTPISDGSSKLVTRVSPSGLVSVYRPDTPDAMIPKKRGRAYVYHPLGPLSLPVPSPSVAKPTKKRKIIRPDPGPLPVFRSKGWGTHPSAASSGSKGKGVEK